MDKTNTQGVTRREFLVRSTVIAGSGFLSIGLPGLIASRDAAGASTPAFTPAIWFTITPDGMTTMHIVKTEMGQHIGTALAQVIADELEVKWEDVRLDTPLESVDNFAIYGLAYTVNSGSVTTEFDRIARAGAAGRIVLVEAGAKLLGAKVADCRAESSRIIDKVSGRSVGYGEILQKVKIDRKFSYPMTSRAFRSKTAASTRSSASRSPRSTFRPRPMARPSTASMCSCQTWLMARWWRRVRAMPPRC